MSTARFSSAQKPTDVHPAPEQSTSRVPLLSTLTEVVQLLFHATRNRDFTTGSPFALATIRQALNLTQPYLALLQQELLAQNFSLPPSEHKIDRATTTFSPTNLTGLVRELARSRVDRRNGSVRLTVLGDVYRFLDEEVRGARREVKRLEHVVEGRHTRKREKKKQESRGLGGGGEGEGSTREEESGSAGVEEVRSGGDKRGTSMVLREGEDAGRGQEDTERLLTTSPTRSNRPSRHGSVRSTSDTSVLPSYLVEKDVTREQGSDKSIKLLSSRPVSRSSRLTKSPTIPTSSGSEKSSKTSRQSSKAGKVHSADDPKSTQLQSLSALRSLDRPASHTPKQSSLPQSDSIATSHRQRHSTSSSADSRISGHPGSAVATLGTDSRDKGLGNEGRGRGGGNAELGVSVQATADGKDKGTGTVAEDHVAFGDRLGGGWSFGALRSGTGF